MVFTLSGHGKGLHILLSLPQMSHKPLTSVADTCASSQSVSPCLSSLHPQEHLYVCLFKAEGLYTVQSIKHAAGVTVWQGGAVHLTLTQSSGLPSHCPTGAASCAVTLPHILSGFAYTLLSPEARNHSCVSDCALKFT